MRASGVRIAALCVTASVLLPAALWAALPRPVPREPTTVAISSAQPTSARAERVERALLALQDADGGWALHELRRDSAERSSAHLLADRLAATRAALDALERGPDSDARRAARERARAWLARQPAPRATLTPRDARDADPSVGARLVALREAIAAAEREPGRHAEEALLAALDASFRTRLHAERAVTRAPGLRVALGLAELELTERLSRAVELLPPAHAARYRSRLREEALERLDADGRVRDPRRARGVSSLATARALLVLRRDAARGD